VEKAMKIKFKQIAKSLTGISTPIFGVSWSPPKSDQEIVRKLIAFFEDRRALYNPFNIETPIFVDLSILEIRKKLTEILENIDESSDIVPHLRALRAAARKYMDEREHRRHHRMYLPREEFSFAALGELRAIFGIHLAQLAVKYGIDVEEDLASIFPEKDEFNDKENGS